MGDEQKDFDALALAEAPPAEFALALAAAVIATAPMSAPNSKLPPVKSS